MGKDLMVSLDVDVEEGEISDSASVEEISAEDFDLSAKSPAIRPEVGTVKNAFVEDSKQHQQQQSQKVWTMNDLVKYQKKYQMSRNYAPGLYNFAWAQAVQNKPLDDFVTTNTSNKVDKHPNDDGDNDTGVEGYTVKNDKIIVDISGDDGDSEKEEGELEEGEIDLDMEVVNANKQGEEGGVEKWINVIRVGLEGITANDANKSFSGVCSRLEDMLDSLSTMLSANSVLNKDDLVQLAFSVIQLVNSVFCSMNQTQKEPSRHIISRLLTNVKSHMSDMFSFEQLKEVWFKARSFDRVCSYTDIDIYILWFKQVDNMILACNSNDVSSSTKDNDMEGDKLNHVNQKADSLSEESISDAMPTGTSDKNSKQSDSLKIQTSTFRNRILLPLLDLHKDHDVDSLPSPTRETTNSLPLGKALFGGEAEIRPEWPTPTPRAVLHRYETDALKAVSTYQQKFSRSSFLSNDLPSPTPSEESGEAGGDCGGEVSSFTNVQNSKSLASAKRNTFSIPERPNVQLLANARNAAPVYSTSSSVSRVSNKTRDPRLRLANPENSLDVNKGTLPFSSKQATIEKLDSRKQKTFDEPVLVDGPAPKRHKNEFSDSVNPGNFLTVSQTRGLENAVTSALPSTSSGSVHVPVTGFNTTSASLQSILKDIAVNPTQWMNLISMEQQRSVDPANHVRQSSSQSSLLGSMPMATVASQPIVVEKRSVDMQIPQIASTDDLGKLRMKPRDPRRALHSKSLQKQDTVTKLSTVEGTKGNIKQTDPRVASQPTSTQADPRVSSQPISTPDITHLFTKNLKNIADIVSTTTSASVQMPSSQPPQVHPSFVNPKGPLSQPGGRLQDGTGPASEESGLGPSQSHNTWGDVEQFFGRFDDQQRAAIQRERSKRMEEQKKMFADRKLCLVLDLDHTLLNSAKFSEIEPVHDEMLRKKEEQDRDKPYRHLFRFPHMGMWTKLRPGIWKFLEKASKLYELHLYTMGNKLYATEMAKVLDPKGVLFNGRVISKGDDGDNADGDPKSKDLEGVWVWNQLLYIYFPCSRRQFGLPGPSLLEIDHDERPEDGTLASSLAVIEKIHQLFFLEKSLDEADVRNILASEQRKILGGCRIVFSRVFPVGEASPHLHPLWQTAEQFGAICTNQIDEHVTHVVANSLGTDKVNWALATGRPVVHPGWVEASALLYRRANEHDFAVKP
ncbi:hypothetical protein E3N88_45770 [Mikania micrantha]|uniref:protein-serine/threonine phosphatase n=1 Tax=Mikania micrantha TaxID=192012 RepID=A0A5N6LAJ5_9ASTR|nr:hypothetical protein E3N88_45770 [Mikania micrantha]